MRKNNYEGHRDGANRGPRPGSGDGRYRGGSNRPRGESTSSGERRQREPERQDRQDNRGPYSNRDRKPRHFDNQGARGERRPGGSWVEIKGRTKEDALEEAKQRFNVPQEQMRIDVVDKGSKGFFGLGGKPVVLKVSLRSVAVPQFAEAVLTRLLRAMSMPDKVARKRDSDGNSVLDIQGPSGAVLIGRHGQTLEALQYLVSKMIERVTGDDRHLIIVDVEGYCERQRDKLREMAVGMAKKVVEKSEQISLQPMSPRDRRVVHVVLKDHEGVITQSVGEGLRRRVVILPKQKPGQPVPVPNETQDPVLAAPVETQTPVLTEAEGPEPGNANPPEPAVTAEPVVEIGNQVEKVEEVNGNQTNA